MKKIILFSFFVAMGFATKAQMKTGNNPTTIGNGQLLELEKNGTRAGFKIAEVALTSATDVSTVNIASTAVGTMVWNTATAGTSPNDVSPGFYIWEGTKWGKVSTSGSSSSGGSGGTVPSASAGTVMVINNGYDSYAILNSSTPVANRILRLELTSLSSTPVNTIGATVTNDNTNGDYITLPAGVYHFDMEAPTLWSNSSPSSSFEIYTEPTTGGGSSLYDTFYSAHQSTGYLMALGVPYSTTAYWTIMKTDGTVELSEPTRVRIIIRATIGNSSADSFTIKKVAAVNPPLYGVKLMIRKLN